MKHSIIFLISLFLMLVSCTSIADPDLALIETIENNLLPALMVEGEEVGDMNILEMKSIATLSVVELNRLAGQYMASFQGNEYIFQIKVLENH